MYRLGTYLFGQTAHDKTTNVKANIVKQTISLNQKIKNNNKNDQKLNSFNLRMKENTPKF